jgi:hypothetical protein
MRAARMGAVVGPIGKGQVYLHAVRIAPAVLLFDDVARFTEVMDEVESPVLGDPEPGREVA